MLLRGGGQQGEEQAAGQLDAQQGLQGRPAFTRAHGVDDVEAGVGVLGKDAAQLGDVVGLSALAEAGILVAVAFREDRAAGRVQAEGIALLGLVGQRLGGRHVDQQPLQRRVGLAQSLERSQGRLAALDAALAGVNDHA